MKIVDIILLGVILVFAAFVLYKKIMKRKDVKTGKISACSAGCNGCASAKNCASFKEKIQ